MTAPSEGVPPFRLSYSGLCRSHLRLVLLQAGLKGRWEEFSDAARGIDARLEWIPLDFGEPTPEYVHLGLQEYVGTVPPFVVTYTVDEARRIVYVTKPVKLLPNSGL